MAAELRALTPGSATVPCDVSDTAALRQALDGVTATQGPIDLLVNNAAQDPGVRLVDIGEHDFRHTFDVNFFAPVAATLAVMPGMIERRHGTIINVSSDGGRLPSPGPGAYPSSKAALSAFSESTSFRLTPKGVSVHDVYPMRSWRPSWGWVRSHAACAGRPGSRPAVWRRCPAGYWPRPGGHQWRSACRA